MIREKIPAIGRIGSLLVLIVAIIVIVTAFIRARRQPPFSVIPKGPPVLSGKVVSIIEGYKYTESDPKTGREKLRMLAAKDTAYEDGRHELEKVDLTAFNIEQGKSLRIVSDRGVYLRNQGQVTFSGAVKVRSSDGLEVTTESLTYEQQSEIARTEVPVQFRHGEISGSSVGATLRGKDHVLTLTQSARVVNADPDPNKPDPNKKNAQPVEIRGDRAEYVEKDGTVKFEGNVNVTQGERQGRADLATGFVNPQTKRLERIEARGNSRLETREKGKSSEAQSRDMDFFFDEERRLKNSAAYGDARARSLEPDSPREITAERIDITYKPSEKGSDIQLISAQGRAVMKLEAVLGSGKEGDWSERVVEADAMQASLREDGKNLARAEAAGSAVLIVTPKRVREGGRPEKKTLRAPKFTADFFETGNAIKTFVAEPNAVAEFDPIQSEGKGSEGKEKDAPGKRLKKTLSGKKMTANFSQQTQDVSDLTVDGDAKLTEGERVAVAARGVYTASNQNVAMRGKPQLWDSSLRASADEIDTNVETSVSELRGRARTTYFNRETTGGAAPFKNNKQPVTVASDRATVKHNEGAARYVGDARAWQGDDFVRAEYIELDKGERVMTAWNNARSAFYDFEREVEKGRKEIVPVFASSDRIVYTDANRTAHYEGSVKIRQGTDQIDSATADAVIDEENKLVSMTASKDVVMTQPSRRATGDQVVYTAATDTAILTGNFAVVEDHERDAVTKSPKLTLHLRDARIEANDDNNVGSGAKRRVKTTHRIQN
ncbi:MAG TPA: LPS export ABC transporter periplasmic protein LptC [Blastocatellia bacterium]|nr:LPS export ABC transporter periplasmic protein LptC [Blastocatellia bacterium]